MAVSSRARVRAAVVALALALCCLFVAAPFAYANDTYTVTYWTGTDGSQTQTFREGESVTILEPEASSDSSSKFYGWATSIWSGDCTIYYKGGETYCAAKDLNLFAVWKTTKKTSETSKTTCTKCGGDGNVSGQKSCSTCSGSGKIGTKCNWCDGTGKQTLSFWWTSETMKVTCTVCSGTGVKTYTQCTKCGGDGKVNYSYSCPFCSGAGKVWTSKTVRLTQYILYYYGSSKVIDEPEDKSSCKAEASDASSAAKHAFTGVVTPPTCTEKGYTTYTCSRCGISYTSDTAALGHEWDEYVLDENSGSSTAATKTATCLRCGAKNTVVAKAKKTSLSGATVTVADQVYTGSTLKPTATVKLGSKTLKSGTDYTVSYSNNKNAGTATAKVTGKGNYTGTATGTFTISGDKKLSRLAGTDRYKTMAAIVKEGFSSTGGWAIVARGDNFPDALGAAALAGAYDAPIITTKTSSLDASAKAQLNRLKVTNVIVLGDTNSVSNNTVSQIKALSSVKSDSVTRVSGADRYATSLAVYKQFKAKAKSYDTLIVATGGKFADALTAGAYAYAELAPIVLVDTKAGLTSDASAAIKADQSKIKTVVILGDANSVSAATERRLKSLLPKATVERIAGSDRYATNASFTAWSISQGMTAAKPVITTAQKYPDAVAGAPLAGKNNSVLVLADKAADSSLTTLAKYKSRIEHAYLLGDKSTISVSTAKAMASKLGLSYVAHSTDSAKKS